MPRKTVTIRGLDLDLYHRMFSLAKRMGKRVADLMNEAMKFYLEGGLKTKFDGAAEEELPTLSNEGFITLSREDVLNLFEELNEPIVIENNGGKIVFEKGFDRKALRCIKRIVINSGTVTVPREIYHLFLLKSEIRGALEKY